MLDEDFAPAEEDICRDEMCELETVHPSHTISLNPDRSTRARPWWRQRGSAEQQDPAGLCLMIERLFEATEWPYLFADIASEIRNDYGTVSTRTLHRWLQKLKERGWIVSFKYNSGLFAYVRSTSRRLADVDGMREYLAGRRSGGYMIGGQVTVSASARVPRARVGDLFQTSIW